MSQHHSESIEHLLRAAIGPGFGEGGRRWVGADIVQISRFESMARRHPDSIPQIFSEREIDDAAGDMGSLSARWAAREAVAKILGGMGSLRFRDVEVAKTPLGKPYLLLAGKAQRLARDRGLEHWSLSLSHDGDYALAVVVAGSDCGEQTEQ